MGCGKLGIDRVFFFLSTVAAMLLSTRPTCVMAAGAEAGWPKPSPEWLSRGASGNLAIVPLLMWWILAVGWMATSNGLTRDSARHNIRPNLWGAVITIPFFCTALFAWWIPSVLAGQFLMLVMWLGPMIVYIILRNPKVGKAERWLTRDHGRRILAAFLSPFGYEIATGVAEEDLVPAVALLAAGGKNADENTTRLTKSSATAGFEEARKVMLAAVMARALSVLLEAKPDLVSVRHEVDGVWHAPRIRLAPKNKKETDTWIDATPPIQPVGEAVLVSLKTLAGLDPAQHGRQSGVFALQVDGKLRNCRLVSQTAKTGPQLLVHIEPIGLLFESFSDLGMVGLIAEGMANLVTLEKGLLVLSSPPASGLTTTFDVVVGSTDRLTRDFISLEDAAMPPREIQSVKPVIFDTRTGVTAVAALQVALREYPRGIITRDLRDAGLAVELAHLADKQQFVILSMKATDSIEAIAKLLACAIPPEVLARSMLGSLSQRLVRKLCPRCREEYPTPVEFLLKFKRTIEQLPNLKRASPHGCRLCGGTGYFGRAAIFELASGVTLKQAISKKSDSQLLKQAAAKDGLRPMRDQGLLLVIEGITSLDEMQRVFSKA